MQNELLNIDSLKLPNRFKEVMVSSVDRIINGSGIEVLSIYLFGSCGRGKFKATSDIDLLVICKDMPSIVTKASIHEDLTDNLNTISTDVIFTTTDNFLNSNTLFYRLVRRDCIKIWQSSL